MRRQTEDILRVMLGIACAVGALGVLIMGLTIAFGGG